MARYMNLLTDYAFKFVFGSEKHKKVVIKFLNTILTGKEKIVDVNFRDKEQLPIKEDGKRMVFDIYCTTDTNSHIIVEMQVRVPPTFVDRAIAYCSHGVLNQIMRGDRYKYDKVYGIYIMGSHLAYHKPTLVRRISLMDEDTGELFSDKIHMVFLDLKCMHKNYFHECKNDIERYLFLVKNMENMEGKEKGYPMFDDLFEAAELGDLAEDQLIAYSQSRLKLEDDREALEYEVAQERSKALSEGRAEGRAEGIKEGIKEGEKQLLSSIISHLKAQGSSLKQIASLLGRPETEIASLF